MAVSTITLESTNGDSVVVSAAMSKWAASYLDDDIVLDVDPQGMYDAAFTVRTQSGAFEIGGRIVGESVPIRQPILPFWLTAASRARFQRLWGSPGNFQKVTCTWDGPSGPRRLVLKLAKEIAYTTEDGLDAAIANEYHAVVSALAVNPMYEGPEVVLEFTNPGDAGGRFTVGLTGLWGVIGDVLGGTFTLSYGGQHTTDLPVNVTPAAMRTAIAALSSVGGTSHVTVTGTTLADGPYVVQFTGVTGTLTGSTTGLTGLWQSLDVDGANIGWFDVWNPTDQPLWLEWAFDPAMSWQFPDWSFGQERKWGRTVGQDAARMIVTPQLTQLLSVMSDPFMDTYVNADLSNAAGLFNGVEPLYMVPPYTGTEDDPIVMPVVCNGAAGAKATLRQRRFWSAESGLEA